jgi:hypothetical protein
MARFIDLSIPLENDVPSDPPGAEPRIRYRRHGETVPEIRKYFRLAAAQSSTRNLPVVAQWM